MAKKTKSAAPKPAAPKPAPHHAIEAADVGERKVVHSQKIVEVRQDTLIVAAGGEMTGGGQTEVEVPNPVDDAKPGDLYVELSDGSKTVISA